MFKLAPSVFGGAQGVCYSCAPLKSLHHVVGNVSEMFISSHPEPHVTCGIVIDVPLETDFIASKLGSVVLKRMFFYRETFEVTLLVPVPLNRGKITRRLALFHLLVPVHDQWDENRCNHPEDRDDDHQLDEGKALSTSIFHDLLLLSVFDSYFSMHAH